MQSKYLVIAFVVVILLLILTSKKKMHGIDSFKSALILLKKIGAKKETVQQVEKLYRLETAHFTSEQFKNTGSAGMEKHGNAPYYGWTPQLFSSRPIGTYTIKENGTGIPKTFIKFADTSDGVSFVYAYINKYGRAGRWYSLDPNQQMIYESKLSKIRTPITDEIFS